ncbi:hypothetical protein BDV35DRAFT_346764 [Aspergillus flavus]|uniref:Uncharacterized protein n=1 Tax=Aspergillus flavus TaxID=5059 RepID=A0A5N6H541_ASPFL|nr:hypothetical protein BDV35DRAFT_346764 [Aspergillus flavus]
MLLRFVVGLTAGSTRFLLPFSLTATFLLSIRGRVPASSVSTLTGGLTTSTGNLRGRSRSVIHHIRHFRRKKKRGEKKGSKGI